MMNAQLHGPIPFNEMSARMPVNEHMGRLA